MLRDLCNLNPSSASTFAFALVGKKECLRYHPATKDFAPRSLLMIVKSNGEKKGLVLRARLRKRAQRLILTKAWLRDRQE